MGAVNVLLSPLSPRAEGAGGVRKGVLGVILHLGPPNQGGRRIFLILLSSKCWPLTNAALWLKETF